MSIKRKADTEETAPTARKKVRPTQVTTRLTPLRFQAKSWTVSCTNCKKRTLEVDREPVMMLSADKICTVCHEEIEREGEEHEAELAEFKRKAESNTPMTIKEVWKMLKTMGGRGANGNWILDCQEVDEFIGLDENSDES